jgi:hypothetical protein
MYDLSVTWIVVTEISKSVLVSDEAAAVKCRSPHLNMFLL